MRLHTRFSMLAASRIDWFTLCITQLAWGLLPIFAFVIVDLRLHRLNWLARQLWLWIGLLVLTHDGARIAKGTAARGHSRASAGKQD